VSACCDWAEIPLLNAMLAGLELRLVAAAASALGWSRRLVAAAASALAWCRRRAGSGLLVRLSMLMSSMNLAWRLFSSSSSS
jgi:hypothetical protein